MAVRFRWQSTLIGATNFSKSLAALIVLFGAHICCHAVDSASVELATGNFTQMVRAGGQWDWQQKWFDSGNYFLGGYWNLTAADWHSTRYFNRPGNIQNIFDLGVTPVFRLQRQERIGPYFEASIGAHLLSDRYDNNGRNLSTRFEFGDSLGVGYQFAEGWDVGFNVQHFSNGGVEQPNSGVNYLAIRVGKRF